MQLPRKLALSITSALFPVKAWVTATKSLILRDWDNSRVLSYSGISNHLFSPWISSLQHTWSHSDSSMDWSYPVRTWPRHILPINGLPPMCTNCNNPTFCWASGFWWHFHYMTKAAVSTLVSQSEQPTFFYPFHCPLQPLQPASSFNSHIYSLVFNP